MKIAVISANYGGFDPLRNAAQQSVETDFYMFSDKPIVTVGTQWKNIVLSYPRNDLCARMRAKYVKLQHHRIPELRQYSTFVWVDAAIEITSANYVQEMTQRQLGLNVFRHPHRSCIYDEYTTLVNSFPHKIAGEKLTEQINEYRNLGHPRGYGLYALTHFTHNVTAESKRLLDEWWLETIRWTYRDQISFPVVCSRLNYTPKVISWMNPYSRDYVKWHSHP